MIGRVLAGRYEISHFLGSGASARVFLATDRSLQRRVAVKLLHAHLTDDDKVAKRFLAEAQAAARLNHPHLLAVHDWGESDAERFLVTEYLAGGSLRALLDRGVRLSPSQALVIGLQTAQGLAHAHLEGFVHRDVKPANLLFGDDERLRIADFGIARLVTEAAWTEPDGALIGTARYAAPEQASGKTVDGRADVYSLALTLIEAVTGEVPMVAASPLATMVSRQDADVAVPAALGPLSPALASALTADPAERCSAADLAAGLAAAAKELPRPATLPLGPFDQGPVPVAEAALVLGDDRTIEPIIDLEPAALEGFGMPVEGEARSLEDPSFDDPSFDDAVTEAQTDVAVDAAAVDAAAVDAAAVDAAAVDAVAVEAVSSSSRRWLWLVPLLLVPLLGVATWFAFARETVEPIPTFPAGTYVGRQLAEVEAELPARQWTATIVTERRDGTEPGEILQQVPPAGTELEEGSVITLVVSDGPELRRVPTLSGLTKAEAMEAITDANLTVGAIDSSVYDEVAPLGVVIGQSEVAGSELETGTIVDLTVSAGPEPRVIPDLSNRTLDEATAVLVELGLIVVAAEDYSETVAEGLVMAVTPEPGISVARDAEVTVTISLGLPFVTVPDVVGKSAAEAADILTAAGFVVVDTIGPPNSSVIITDPGAGESRRKGTEIVIVTRR